MLLLSTFACQAPAPSWDGPGARGPSTPETAWAVVEPAAEGGRLVEGGVVTARPPRSAPGSPHPRVSAEEALTGWSLAAADFDGDGLLDGVEEQLFVGVTPRRKVTVGRAE